MLLCIQLFFATHPLSYWICTVQDENSGLHLYVFEQRCLLVSLNTLGGTDRENNKCRLLCLFDCFYNNNILCRGDFTIVIKSKDRKETN